MKKGTTFLLALFYIQTIVAQAKTSADSSNSVSATDANTRFHSTIASTKLHGSSTFSPYQTGLLKDGLTITAAAGITLLGYTLIKNKNDLTQGQLATKTTRSLPFFDRGNAGFYSPQANKDSYILFDGSYVIPVAVGLLSNKERSKFGQVMVMYLETMAITGSMYTLTAGLVYRSRPFVYGDKAPLEKRLDKGGQRSFYGGHVATTAAATFFTAKVFQDFNPGSRLCPYLWTAAGGLTVLMGYMRYKAGYHFLSDCVVSAVIGTATGILIPEFHKNRSLKNVTLTPFYENRSKGFSMLYQF